MSGVIVIPTLRTMLLIAAFGLLQGCLSGPATAPVDARQTSEGRTVYREPTELSALGAPARTASAPIRGADWHTVAKGDTLYAIAFLHNLQFDDIAAWNSIREPYLIRVGERLRLTPPEGFAKPPSQSVKAAPVVPPPVAKAKPAPAPAKPSKPTPKPAAKPKPRPSTQVVASGPLRWQWPTRGKIIKKFTTRGTAKRGISIAGKAGQTIKAAAQGRVVYSGSGLVGYGKLVIIKHDRYTLSAYGHNRKLLVAEGDVVRSGQAIAEMGSSDARSTRLHFEVRKRGKPVNPLRYLPRG